MQLNDKRLSPFKRGSKQFSETDFFFFIQLPFLVSEKKKKDLPFKPQSVFYLYKAFLLFLFFERRRVKSICRQRECVQNEYMNTSVFPDCKSSL